MSYIGNKPATAFETVQKQISTSNSGTTITLDRAVTSVQDILLTIDAVVQSYDNYSVSGTTLTVGGTLSNNRVEILYVGRTMQSVDPTDDSVSASKIKTDAVTTAKVQNDAITVDKLNLISTSSVPSLEAKGDGGSQDGYIQLNCSQNSHGVKLKSPPHSANQSYTLTLPSTAPATDKILQTNSSGVLSFVDAPSGGAWTLLQTSTVSSAVSTVEITSMSSSYKTHAVVFDNVIPSSDNDTVRHAIKNSGGSVIQLYNGGDVSILDESGNRSDDTYGQNPTGYGTLAESNGSGSNEGFSGLIYYDSGMFDANLSTKYWGHIISFRANNTYAHSECYGRFANDTASAISYGFNAGNIASGTFKLYGIGG